VTTTISGLLCVCGLEAEGRCDWLVERFENAHIFELRVGDVTASPSEHRRGEILAVADSTYPDLLSFIVALQMAGKKHPGAATGEIKKFLWPRTGLIRVLRIVPCGRAGCYQHIRDLGAEHFICSDHWTSQLEAIAS
jgi:hypothetical protein